MAKPGNSERQTPAERSTKLGVPDAPAGDADAIIEQNETDRRTVRRRERLLEETRKGADGDPVPRDELGEDSAAKSVDDLLE